MKQNLILLIVLLKSITFCYSQSSKLFTADRELSSSLINHIYQDKDGFIWIATEDGLNRYDGAKFTTYKHEDDNPYSLSHSFIRRLFEDNQGRLFICTHNGLQMYDSKKDCFSRPATWNDGRPYEGNINSIIQRKNGDIWVSGNVLSVLNINGDKLTLNRNTLSIPIDISDYIIEDKNENIWVVTNESKIYRFNKENQAKEYSFKKEGLVITALLENTNGDIIVGSIENGLFKYQVESDDFTPIPYNNSYNLPIKNLYQSNTNEVFIGTDGQGLKVYDSEKKTIKDYIIENSNFDVANSKIHSTLIDNVGNMWLAIYQKGVMMISSQPNSFKYIGSRSIHKNIIGNYCVTTLFKDHEGVMWVGTDNDGLYGITKPNGRVIHYNSKLGYAIPDIIITLFEDSEHNLWFGSYTRGMGKIDRKTGKCEYLNGLVDEQGNHIPRVYSIVEDSNKCLWIATMGGGLFCYNLITKQMSQPIPMSIKWLSSLKYCPANNKLYVGSYEGIYAFDLNSPNYASQFELYKHIIHSITLDKNNNVWLGTSDGLACWKQDKGTLIKYTTKDGLPSNVIYAIEQDAKGNLWISTNSGIALLETDSNLIINYFVGDGLQGNEFSKNASFKDKNGLIWFGGVNGISYFNPIRIVKPKNKWNVRITDFYLHNTPVRVGMKSTKRDIIDDAVFNTKKFYLSHSDNSFTIEFATTEFNTPERVSYTYSLNDDKWITLPANTNRISFNNLPAGEYRFQVRAVDYNLISNIKEVTIYIAPAWYASWWAILIYVLLFILAIYITIIQIKHRLKVKRQIIEHKHIEEINEAKLQFFINISHEIRTPMSLIVSPLKQLMTTDNDSSRQRLYHTIHRNSERIITLINQLMDVRKIDKGQMSLHFKQTNLVALINDLCTTFDDQAKSKNIELEVQLPEKEVVAWIDPINFDKVIINLLSNAFKFTPNDGTVTVALRVLSDKNWLEISVSDTGVGINENEMNKIFERFYQIRNSSNNSNIGTGIGLHLTQSLVKLHHGDIKVESNEGCGSRFIITLPLGNNHLRPEEMDHQKDMPILQTVSTPVETLIESEDDCVVRSKSKHRVLIVEDDEEIRKYLAAELSGLYHIAQCSNGKEALGQILKKSPTLVISDVMMPEMDGLTLCRKIKKNVNINHIPVILLTAKNSEEDNMEGLDIGVDAYITKPFNIDIVKKTIDNIIKNREVLRNCFTGSQEQEVKKPIYEIQSINDKLLDRIMNVITLNLSSPDLNVEFVAKEVGISRVHLHRKLKEITNQSTRDFIRNIRLKHAAHLLTKTDYNMSEVADIVGISSPTLFSRLFKDLYGVTPREYAASINDEEHSNNELINN